MKRIHPINFLPSIALIIAQCAFIKDFKNVALDAGGSALCFCVDCSR